MNKTYFILFLLTLLQQACAVTWLLSQLETSNFQLKYACGQPAAAWYGVVQIHTHVCRHFKIQKIMSLHVKNFQICSSGLKKEKIKSLLRKRKFFFLVSVHRWPERHYKGNEDVTQKKVWRGGASSGQNKETQDQESVIMRLSAWWIRKGQEEQHMN